MDYLGFDAYEKSINMKGPSTVFMAKEGGEDFLVISGRSLGFIGEKFPEKKMKAPLNHKNAKLLRKLFPFTAPTCVLSQGCSFGVGDRLGIASPWFIKIFEKYDAYPVLAQQSMRELNLTGRTYEEVLDAATFAVFRAGYTKGWGADGDHLKTAADVKHALTLGFSIITLDCSDHINNNATDDNAPPLSKKIAGKYLGKEFDLGEGLRFSFNEADLKKIAAVYENAISFAAGIYKKFLRKGKYNADFEISIDETSSPTTPQQHYFVAKELIDAGVHFATIAPRFCGEFQKGIDYKGDLAQFEKEIVIHAAIARHFRYKLSIHSGSDKFSVFPAIGQATRNVVHVKTAGTNWLEAMRVVARKDPALYREVHKYALEAFEDARKYYHVTADPKNIPDVDKITDRDLDELLDQNDSRQLIHITYGQILSKKAADGSFAFRKRLYKLWKDHADDYGKALDAHIGKHLTLLGVKMI